jgi:iron complex outermembrane receptor protein
MNSRLSQTIFIILSGASLRAVAVQAEDGATAATDALQEIVVTATRRSENMQDVPISMQAFTGQTLSQLKIETLDDYIKYLPNVSAANSGPGQSDIFMRGLSAGVGASQNSGSTGLFPNVAIYLDNQSGQLPNHNLDVYAADLDRIEVLEGPQGTLFGAGAEAGAIRYITNQPKLDVTEGNVSAGYGTTAHGDNNSNVTAVLNLPLIPEKMAIRGVIYNDSRGGYIDNVPATFARKNTDPSIHYANYPAVNGQCPDGLPNGGYCVPPESPVINNNNIAGRAINPVTYQGARAEVLFKFNDDWDVLLSQMYQDMNSQGVFYQQPYTSNGGALAPLEVTLFNNAYDKDRFENTALTVNGAFGPIKAVYTGGYLVRNLDAVGDYTNYARGVYADYYQCYGPGSGGEAHLAPTCFSPSSVWIDVQRNDQLQQEIRLSTPDDWRFRGIVGAYYGDNKIYDQTSWLYKSLPACTADGPAGSPGNSGCESNVGTPPGATVQAPGVKGDTTSFYSDVFRETKQTAFFVSFDYDIIPKVLTATFGTRHYLFQNSSTGSNTPGFGCFDQGSSSTGCLATATNLNALDLRDTESGFKSRANLTWHVTPDAMLYYTFSQGFRPGGFSQAPGAEHGYGPDGVAQFITPRGYVSDKLTNNEIGWKTELFDHHLQWNGAFYRENWNNVQVPLFDPGVIGSLFINLNGQNFLIKGVETSLIARPFSGFTLQYAASWNHSEQTNSPTLTDNNPQSANYGKPITEVCSEAGTGCSAIGNPFGPIGSPSANSPPAQFSLRGRYEWSMGTYGAFVQGAASHIGHSFTQAGANPIIADSGVVTSPRLRFENPAYSTFDASIGISKDSWNVQIFGQNLADSHAATYTSSDQFIVTTTPLRPRVLGVSFGYRF